VTEVFVQEESAEAKTFVVQSDWIGSEGNRLGARSFAEGGLATRNRVMASHMWKPLVELARVFRGPLHKRVFVRDPERGIPYLPASDVQLADLPRDTLLSAALTPELSVLRVEAGWTLVSSAGTVGNATYVRNDMREFAVSQDMLRVAPLDEMDTPGYLYAYLATGQARAMLRLKIYGSVVDRIEPKHAEDLPVLLPDRQEMKRIDAIIKSASVARTEATQLLDEVAVFFDNAGATRTSRHDHARAVGVLNSDSIGLRLDAFHHIGWAAEAPGQGGEPIETLAEIISTQRVPRIYAKNGLPFLSGIDVFRCRPTARVRLAGFVADAFGARVQSGDIAIQGSGQRYGLLGRAAYIGPRLDGWTASHDLFRIRARDSSKAARIFAYLRSDVGHRSMLRHSYGTSIPHVNPQGIAALCIPGLPDMQLAKAMRAIELRQQADRDEEQAIREVEAWLS
jgi:type I restriction enzyme S subunit